MIYTITLDATLDRIIEAEEFLYDDVNEVVEEKRSAGGKGIDVSRVIKELGGESVAIGFVGGYNGSEIEGRLVGEGIISDFTRVVGESRSNMVIHQRKKKMLTSLSTSAEAVSHCDAATLYSKIRNIPGGSLVIMSGSLCPGLDTNFYAQMITTLKERDIKVFLDTDGEVFRKGVEAAPFMIKPNIHEFGRLVEKNIRDYHEVLENIGPYLALSEYIVVSMGARGAIAFSRDERYLVVPPKVTMKRSAGAGDALLGGFVFGISKGMNFRDAITLGVSCGTAFTVSTGQERFSCQDLEDIEKQVVTNKV